MPNQVDHTLNLIRIAYLSSLLAYLSIISWIQMYLFWCYISLPMLFLFVLLHFLALWCWYFFCNVPPELIWSLQSCCLQTMSKWILQLFRYFLSFGLSLLVHQLFLKASAFHQHKIFFWVFLLHQAQFFFIIYWSSFQSIIAATLRWNTTK